MRTVTLSAMGLCVLLCLTVIGLSAAADRPTERVSPAPEVNPNAVIWRMPEPPKDPQGGDVWVNPKDGMEMVYIPPGEFILGSSDAQIDAWVGKYYGYARAWLADEQPQCRVRLPGYWVGRTEVTNAQYLRFVQATAHRAPYHWEGGKVPAGLESFPVVCVSSEDAHAYCEWAGDRLPSELEWEKAARGTDGRIFPWGNEWDSRRCRNVESLTGRSYLNRPEMEQALEQWLRLHDRNRDGPTAVGSYPAGASPYGCLDMAGNVWEWCGDWYDESVYQRYARGDLKPPATGTKRLLRGSCWGHGDPDRFRCAYRFNGLPLDCSDAFGFRCARGLP